MPVATPSRKMLGLAAALTCTTSVAAHDFWVQPNAFWLRPGAAMPVTLQVGHGPLRQRSPIPLRRITRFAAITPAGSAIDLRASLHPGGADDSTIGFRNPGTYMLVLETDTTAQSHLPAIRYNDYLKVEGLTPALTLRARTGRTGTDGSENYGRIAKAIVQVGPPGGSQAQVTKPLGLALEIVPEISPYAMPRSALLPVRVIYHGRPLAGALIKLTDLDHDEAPFETHRTDAAGRARFAMPRRGSWLINVIWTRPLPAARETDFETVFSSLSFGFPARR
ncbi:DUF4198 domain-containing protein [Sphingomonas sp. So64.6b]|uniref:DUF4198 domain-containing protein n=1 Tax=Sphingomonas sp. So64.6b TaxID=2997354 RepID=UPI001FCE7587|nr:DUF4198 domain-containing protein [Sphingomonas sp. So64.6b]